MIAVRGSKVAVVYGDGSRQGLWGSGNPATVRICSSDRTLGNQVRLETALRWWKIIIF